MERAEVVKLIEKNVIITIIKKPKGVWEEGSNPSNPKVIKP
jgi:hypothetical protein